MNDETGDFAAEGGCSCNGVRYRLTAAPMIVHCCHCRWCQRETGGAFVLNALVESAAIALLAGATEAVDTPSESGKGQTVHRCPSCHVALWSHYPGGGPGIAFLRVGTLDDPDRLPPDIHIYTASKQPWLVLPEGARAVSEYYDPRAVWPAESIARYKAARDAARTV